MLTRLLAVFFCVTMVGAASAEIAMDGDRHFGLFPTVTAPTAVNGLKRASPPSFQQPHGTGVILRGNGRFGLVQHEQRGAAADVTVNSRLRLDLDVSHQTDSGVTFGGQVRVQSSSGSGTGFSAPTLYSTWD